MSILRRAMLLSAARATNQFELFLPEISPPYLDLAKKIMEGEMNALSRAITLCESWRQDHRTQAASLMQFLTENSPSISEKRMFRIGVTGPPGTGKSSLIEKLGLKATENEEKVAVLAIDPSSQRSGGSILGDKTRMEELSKDTRAFVRPTPSRGQSGGIAQSTADAALLCEAAGCSVLFVETVGGGQSDVAVADMVDVVLLVLPPAGGDELQGIKKGVVEVADIVVVNKADGALKEAAEASLQEYQSALHFTKPLSKNWNPPVVACSARTCSGLSHVWLQIENFKKTMIECGELQQRRELQLERLLWSNVQNELLQRFHESPELRERLALVQQKVGEGQLATRAAAHSIVESFLRMRQ